MLIPFCRMYVELLHRIILNFLDLYVTVDAISRDG
jgi:hypothetical protein